MGSKLKFETDILRLPQMMFNVMTYFCINIIPLHLLPGFDTSLITNVDTPPSNSRPLGPPTLPVRTSYAQMYPRERALLASHIFSTVKSFALVEILVARGFRLALRGGKGLAKRLTLFCSRAESNLPLFYYLGE